LDKAFFSESAIGRRRFLDGFIAAGARGRENFIPQRIMYKVLIEKILLHYL
jgi:hypothetical protein